LTGGRPLRTRRRPRRHLVSAGVGKLRHSNAAVPEQVWDGQDCRRRDVLRQRTGAAMPLMWAHADETSALPATASSSISSPRSRASIARASRAGQSSLEIQPAVHPSRSRANCASIARSPSRCTGARTNGITSTIAIRLHTRWDSISSISTPLPPTARRRFTFHWIARAVEGRDYAVELRESWERKRPNRG